MHTSRFVLLTTAALAAATLTARAAAAQTPVRFSAVGGFSLPEGDLASGADLGVNLGFRGEGRISPRGWALRGDLSWDHYDGHGPVNAYSYYALAGNVVHHEGTGRLYEFGGLGIYNSRVQFPDALDRSETNLGVQLGFGLNFSRMSNMFTEFGLTSAFTSGRSSAWFPVRLGVRF